MARDAGPSRVGGVPQRVGPPQGATLHTAAAHGDLAALDELAGTPAGAVEVNAPDRFSSPPLHYAAGGGHVAAVERLVALRADPDVINADGETALHAAVKCGHARVVSTLLILGADPARENCRLHPIESEGNVTGTPSGN